MKRSNQLHAIASFGTGCALLLASALSANVSASTVAQSPLFIGAGNVPGNLALVPSVEWPTVLSAANIGSFNEDEESIGYFDSDKCYRYKYEGNEANRHFYPVSAATNRKCPGNFWSGNFLNWATTQTIDPFRWALTGGYRVKDTVTETWVEKARHSGQNNYFDVRNISGASVVNNATPFSTASFQTKVGGLSNQMHFTLPSGHGFNNQITGSSTNVFSDQDFSGWQQYSSGDVTQSTTKRRGSSGYALKKINNDDSNGGFKNIPSGSVSYGSFAFEGWIYRPTVGTQSGQSDRLALSNASASGYGFNISQGNIRIERRSSGSATTISSTVNWTRPTDQWYRFRFESVSGNKFQLTVYNDAGTQLATVTSNSDTSYNNFSRVYVHGGHEYYVDDLTIDVVTGVQAYDIPDSGNGNKFGTTVRVKVCDPTVGVEEHCKQYGANWKPEGLIQRYSDRIRYSIFGYLNDSNFRRDGGVLRARKKFVGPEQIVPSTGLVANPNKEWDETTGVMIQNPDPTDASDTAGYFGVTVANSGVLNYLNKFGQLNSNNFKSYDPVSELYYTALRYYKNQGSVDEYYTKTPAHNSSPGSSEKAKWVDGFPVVRSWNDPVQYACQKNVVLGIGDVNTHRDKNLPGATSGTDEPSKPSEVSGDLSVNARTATDKVAQLENISIDTGAASYSGRNNSALMAGLAYDANTRDIRPDANDFAGTQTVQTYWVDVLENEVLRDKRNNQFWLTAKYGGFVPRKHPDCDNAGYVPSGTECNENQVLGDPYLRTSPLPEWWWYTNTDVLDPNSGSDYKRADNFYTAGEARKMVDGLTQAFASIAASVKGAASALTANTGRVGTGSAVYNALMDSDFWSGDLIARGLDSGGNPEATNIWSAADVMDAIPEADLVNRKIFTSTYAAKNISTGITKSAGSVEFKWSSLAAEQKDMLKQTPASGPVTDLIGQQRLDFLRGSRLLEQTDTNTSNPFRRRNSRLGDIVNSSPQYVYKREFDYRGLISAFSSSIYTDYANYRSSSNYVNKPPIIAVGANDGMLHIFDASTGSDGGKELFAYIPGGVFNNLHELTSPDYTHRYFVDGTAAVFDAWFAPGDVSGGVSSGWKSVLAVTPGAGGRGVSLLDVSNPNGMSASSVLWEFQHEKMGSLIQQPFVVALANGKFGVVINSGFVHGQSEGYIWILNIANGQIIKELTVPVNAGLGMPAVVDINRDGVVDRIYQGDTSGNVWRFDINDSATANWASPFALLTAGGDPKPLFTAKDPAGINQPITGPLNATLDSRGRVMLLFGTGSYHLINDNQVSSSSQIQSLYGIKDLGSQITSRSQLLEQQVLLEGAIGSNRIRVTSDHQPTLSSKGWYLDLAWKLAQGGPGAQGELIDTRPVLRFGRVIVASKIPSEDPCAAGGSSWLMSLDYESGATLDYTVWDYNSDGQFDSFDQTTMEITNPDGSTRTVVVDGSGIQYGKGFINVGDGSIIGGLSDDVVKVCLSNSQTDTISCPVMKGSFRQGRTGWREIR